MPRKLWVSLEMCGSLLLLFGCGFGKCIVGLFNFTIWLLRKSGNWFEFHCQIEEMMSFLGIPIADLLFGVVFARCIVGFMLA